MTIFSLYFLFLIDFKLRVSIIFVVCIHVIISAEYLAIATTRSTLYYELIGSRSPIATSRSTLYYELIFSRFPIDSIFCFSISRF